MPGFDDASCGVEFAGECCGVGPVEAFGGGVVGFVDEDAGDGFADAVFDGAGLVAVVAGVPVLCLVEEGGEELALVEVGAEVDDAEFSAGCGPPSSGEVGRLEDLCALGFELAHDLIDGGAAHEMIMRRPMCVLVRLREIFEGLGFVPWVDTLVVGCEVGELVFGDCVDALDGRPP